MPTEESSAMLLQCCTLAWSMGSSGLYRSGSGSIGRAQCARCSGRQRTRPQDTGRVWCQTRGSRAAQRAHESWGAEDECGTPAMVVGWRRGACGDGSRTTGRRRERERRRLARVRERETDDASNGTVHWWAASASTRVRPMGFLSGPKKIRRGAVW